MERAVKGILFKEFSADKGDGKEHYGRTLRLLSDNEKEEFDQNLETAVKKLVSEIKAGQADKIFNRECLL